MQFTIVLCVCVSCVVFTIVLCVWLTIHNCVVYVVVAWVTKGSNSPCRRRGHAPRHLQVLEEEQPDNQGAREPQRPARHNLVVKPSALDPALLSQVQEVPRRP